MECQSRIRSMRPSACATALALLALAAAGCASLEDRIVEPHSRPMLDPAFVHNVEENLGITRHRARIPDGPELAYRVVAAKAYGIQYEYTRTDGGARFNLNTTSPPEERAPIAPVGTAVLLHGWSMEGSSMLPWAIALAERGWQSIVVDLRNHGDSGRAPAGYGPREGRDVTFLVDALRAAGQVKGPLALFGVSYGAVTAIHAAADDSPHAVHAVIAMSPYANAADGIHDMIEGMKAMPGAGLRGRLALGYARRRYDQARVERAIQTAGERIGLDLAAIDVRQAAAAVPACTLLLHGTEDGFFAMETVQAIADAAARGQLVALEGEHHFSAPMRVDWLAAPLADWLDGVAAGVECPAFALPAPPEAPQDSPAAAGPP